VASACRLSADNVNQLALFVPQAHSDNAMRAGPFFCVTSGRTPMPCMETMHQTQVPGPASRGHVFNVL